jgi:hypothetical protein
MKIRSVEATYSMGTEGQADMTNLTIAFHNFADASKNGKAMGGG